MPMNTKNIIISIGAVLLIGLIFLFQFGSDKNAKNPQIVEHPVTATSTQNTESATSAPVVQAEAEKPAKPAATGLNIFPGVFHYDVVAGKTLCGDKIGTFTIESTVPGEKLYWELDGMKPMWMNLSSTWGETPAHVDMTYNCILSGASDGVYQAAFDVMRTDKDGGKKLHKYIYAVLIDGKITLESK